MTPESTLPKNRFVTAKPCAKLRDYIAYYYFDESEADRSFVFYPHYRNALTIYKQAEVEIREGQSFTCANPTIDYRAIYCTIQPQAIQVNMIGPYAKLGVVFMPLGINVFLNQFLSNYIADSWQLNFDEFTTGEKARLDLIYETTGPVEKAALLDAYFLERLRPFDEPLLKKAVNYILTQDNKFSVQDLAEELGINRRKLLRLFQRHLCCSVKHFIDVVRFRKALNTYQANMAKPSLTHLAHDLNYYDQSELIHHFRKITGVNPKKFFGDISWVGQEDTFWSFIRK